MPKTLGNKEYYEKVIKPQHRPLVREVGSQRDSVQQVYCSCQFYDTLSISNAILDYQDHLVEILNKEFSIFNDTYIDDYR